MRERRPGAIILDVTASVVSDLLEPPGLKPRRIVVLGTGTDVGKTYVGVQLCEALRAKGVHVLGLKPVESGVPEHSGIAADATALQVAAGQGAAPLYALVEPIGPHVAARRANISIQLTHVLNWVVEQERKNVPEVCVIETAGGAFSPLTDQLTNADLAAALAPDTVILVAPDRLGVLHDVGATLRALGEALRVDLLVLSETQARDASTGSNRAEIEGVVLPQLGLHTPCVTCARGGTAAWGDLWPLLVP